MMLLRVLFLMINLGAIKMINKKELEEVLGRTYEMKNRRLKRTPFSEQDDITPVSEQGSYIVPMMMAMYGTSLLKMGLDFYEKNYSKYARQCGGLPEGEKSICMVRAKKKALEGEISVLEGSIAKCAKAKDAAICEQKVRTKINSLKGEIGYLADRLSKHGVSANVQ
jgi:hypothetical protein